MIFIPCEMQIIIWVTSVDRLHSLPINWCQYKESCNDDDHPVDEDPMTLPMRPVVGAGPSASRSPEREWWQMQLHKAKESALEMAVAALDGNPNPMDMA